MRHRVADRPTPDTIVRVETTHGQIDYGRLPRRRRKWPWVLAVTLAVLGAVTVRQGPAAWEGAKFLAFERSCLGYERPADFVVYAEDPALGDALLAGPQPVGGGYQASPPSVEFPHVYFTPDVWVKHPLCKWEPGPAFLHRVRNPNGEVRLVAVEFGGRHRLAFYPRVIVPGSFRSGPRRVVNRFVLEMARNPSDKIHVFAGQPDPQDPTHFTIGYTVNGHADTIDGWLAANDTVRLEPRQGRVLRKPNHEVAWRPLGSVRPGTGKPGRLAAPSTR